jgi:hypothetical protein
MQCRHIRICKRCNQLHGLRVWTVQLHIGCHVCVDLSDLLGWLGYGLSLWRIVLHSVFGWHVVCSIFQRVHALFCRLVFSIARGDQLQHVFAMCLGFGVYQWLKCVRTVSNWEYRVRQRHGMCVNSGQRTCYRVRKCSITVS